MAVVRNIEGRIKCKYSKECKDYCIWHGGSKFSKCVNCRNNEYEYPKKKSYYSRPLGDYIIIGIICVIGLGIILIGII